MIKLLIFAVLLNPYAWIVWGLGLIGVLTSIKLDKKLKRDGKINVK